MTNVLHPDAPTAASSLSPTDVADYSQLLKNQAQRVLGKLPLLGAVGWLMMQQPATRHTLLSELEWRVMPPLVLEQAKVYLREGAPVAYVSWAKLSDDVARRYMEAPHHLTAADWKSGEQIWIVDLCTPFGGAQEVVKDLQSTLLAGQAIRQLHMGTDEKPKGFVWPPH